MNKKRIFVYVLVFVFAVLMVRIRQNRVMRARKSEPITFYGEWRKRGKPIVSKKIFRRDAPVCEKITLKAGKGGEFHGYVPGNIREKIGAGRRVCYGAEKGEVCGRIIYVSDRISLDAGMYPVKAVFSRGLKKGERIVACVEVKKLKNVLLVPRDIVVWEDDGYYLWKVAEGRAARAKIRVDFTDIGAVVKKGVKPGDRIIYEGFSNLYEGDRIFEVKPGDLQ